MLTNSLQTPSQPCPQSPGTDDDTRDTFNSQIISFHGRNAERQACPANSGTFICAGNGNSPLPGNRLCSFVLTAIQASGNLMHNAAEFAAGQVMGSDDIDWLCPELKQSLVALAALSTLVQTAGAAQVLRKCRPDHHFGCDLRFCFPCGYRYNCRPLAIRCNGRKECPPYNIDERGCTQRTCEDLGRRYLCGNSTCSNTPCSTTPPKTNEPTLSSMNTSFTPSSVQIFEPPTSFFNQTTNSTKTSPLRTNDTSSPTSGNTPETVSAVVIGAIIILGALTALYCVSSYQSYRVLRRNDDESSTCQLIGRALANPMYFHTHQQQATDRRADDELLDPPNRSNPESFPV